MNIYRNKPEIGKRENYLASQPKSDNWGCVIIPLGIVISYVITLSIVNVIYNHSTIFEEIVCYGILIFVIIILIMGVNSWSKDIQAMELEKKKWKKGCATSLVKIVNRDCGTWDDGYKFHSFCWLQLEMNPDQISAFPNNNIVQVEVGQDIYDRLKKCNLVRIYYQPESPLTFLLENE